MTSNALAAFVVPPIDPGWTVRAIFAHFGLGFLFAWLAYLLICGFFFGMRARLFSRSLKVGFWGAWMSLVIDLDHAVLFFGEDYGRPLHKPAAWLAAVVAAIAALRLACLLYQRLSGAAVDHQRVDRLARWIILPLCVVVHVYEDFTYGLF